MLSIWNSLELFCFGSRLLDSSLVLAGQLEDSLIVPDRRGEIRSRGLTGLREQRCW